MSHADFFNLSDPDQGIPRQLAEGIAARVFAGEQAMLSLVTLTAGAEGKIHQHPEEQWGVMLEGSGVRIQDGREVPIQAGDFWRTPGGVPHGIKAGPFGAKVLDIFAPPRAEYRKAGQGFGESS
jgi:quercetin dioxygenase-like cupin family protein